MATKPDVPFEKVAHLAQLVADKQVLEDRKAGTMAEMIRGCIAAIRQTQEEAQRKLEREHRRRRVGMFEAAKKVRQDRDLAFLHLEWLATQLENQSVRSPDAIDQGEASCSSE